MHGRDGVGMVPYAIFEQLVDPAIRKLPGRAGETLQLELELFGGKQALVLVLGLRIGSDQRERGQVVTDDAGGGLRVDDLGPVTHPQHGLPARAGRSRAT